MTLSLHKRKGPVLYYWQAWIDGRRLWIRQGEVGAPGHLSFVPLREDRDPEEALVSASREPRADGFGPLDEPPGITLRVHLVAAEPGATERLSRTLFDTGNDGRVLHSAPEGCTLRVLDPAAGQRVLEQLATELDWDLQISAAQMS